MKAENGISIDSNTRIKVLLDADQAGVIDVLVKLNKNFSKLKSPILRNLFASRVTIADACKVANCYVTDFLNLMQQIGFTVINATQKKELAEDRQHIDFSLRTTVFELDVRPYLEEDKDPLKIILSYVRKLAKGERLRLLNKFEPTPLINLLKDQGFLYDIEALDNDLVVTWFEKTDSKYAAVIEGHEKKELNELERFNTVKQRYPADKVKYIDVRYLEMPNPMLMIMENIEGLDTSELIYVYHKKVPLFLLPELEKRGLSYLFNHHSNTGIDMLIYKL